MPNVFTRIGERYHPIFRLRKYRAFHVVSHWCDVPFGIRIKPIPHLVFVSLSKNLSLVLSGGEFGESNERKYFTALVNHGQFTRFVDVGANIGVYGFTFRSLTENPDVLLIEPDERNVRLLRRTIARSAVRNVKVLQSAASDTSGMTTFYADDITGATGSIAISESKSFIFRHHRRTPKSVTVQCVTLDSLFQHAGQDPEFIKIDVEGAEMNVLRGAVEILSRSFPALFFECDANRSQASTFLQDKGYVFFDFSSMRESTTIPHNCLALHVSKHATLIDLIRNDHFAN